MKTLIIFSHSYFSHSRVNKALLETAKTVPGVTVRNLEELYGTDGSKIDVEAEQRALEGADRVVFQFPVFWYNAPSMLKAYIDNVFTHGWAYGSKGHALVGKKFLIAASFGSPAEQYVGGETVEKLLLPWIVAGKYVGMDVEPVFATCGAFRMPDEELEAVCESYRRTLEN